MNIWVAARCGNLDAAANPAIHSAARGVAARGGALTLRVPRAYMTPPLAGWQSGYATDCKSVYSGSIPLPASNFPLGCASRCRAGPRPGSYRSGGFQDAELLERGCAIVE